MHVGYNIMCNKSTNNYLQNPKWKNVYCYFVVANEILNYS